MLSFAAAALTVCSLAVPAIAEAANAGDLDPGFGTNGLASIAIGTQEIDFAGIALRADGKIIVAGDLQNPITARREVVVARLTTSGALDTTFGLNGYRQLGALGTDYYATAMALQGDERIVVAGMASGTPNRTLVVRFTADGEVDGGFTPVLQDWGGGAGSRARAVAVQGNGAIVAAGNNLGPNHGFAVNRYLSSGANDPTFNGGAHRLVQLSADDDEAAAVAIDPNGAIVMAGRSASGAGDRVAIARLTSAGVPDAVFGWGGELIDTNHVGARATALAVQTDGRIVVAGSKTVDLSNIDFLLARYLANGSPDLEFGSGGAAISSHSKQDELASVALQPDGKIVAAGSVMPATDADFAVLRANPNGSPDAGFGTAGLTLTDFGGISWGQASSVAVQPDGKILAGGYTWPVVSSDVFAVTRYQGATDVAPLPPFAQIKSPARAKLKRKRFKRISGTAGPAGLVTRVVVAVRRIDKRALKKKRCVWLRNSKARFNRVRTRNRRCDDKGWLKATGTEAWTYRFRKPLPAGSYEIFVRVTLSNGQVQTTFSRAEGNYRRLKLTK